MTCYTWRSPEITAAGNKSCLCECLSVSMDTEMVVVWLCATGPRAQSRNYKLINYYILFFKKKNPIQKCHSCSEDLIHSFLLLNINLSSLCSVAVVFSHQHIAVKLAANPRQTAALKGALLLIWSNSGGVTLFPFCGITSGRMVSRSGCRPLWLEGGSETCWLDNSYCCVKPPKDLFIYLFIWGGFM